MTLVGAVIVKDEKVIGKGWHERFGGLHAERNALADCKESTEGATIYVTLEPCPMCAGAAINARIRHVYFGAFDPKGGALGSMTDLYAHPFNHLPQVTGGVLADRCGGLLTDFFRSLRERDKKHNTAIHNIGDMEE